MYLHMRYIFKEYGSGSYTKVIGSRSRGHGSKKSGKSPFPQCNTSIGNNASSVKQSHVHVVHMYTVNHKNVTFYF